MSAKPNRTYSAKTGEITREWLVIDAENQTLGRLATVAANLLRGKNKPEFTPNVDTGAFVVIVNAEKIQVSGKKRTQKLYRHHTGFLGGLKTITFEGLINKSPEKVLEHAIKGMIPHTRLGREQGKKLFVYAGPSHPHQAQQPQAFNISEAM